MTNMIAALDRINLQLPELLSEKFVGDLARRVGWRGRKRVLSPVAGGNKLSASQDHLENGSVTWEKLQDGGNGNPCLRAGL